MKKYTPDSSLKDLLENYDISVRAFNVCEEIGLKTIRDVHIYFSKRNDFLEIRNCGIKTKKELHELNQTFFSEFQIVKQPSLFEEYNLETNIDWNIFIFLIETEFDKLSTRGKNALLEYFKGKFPTKEKIEKEIILKRLQPKKLRNIGDNTIIELDYFIEFIINTYYKYLNNSFSLVEIELMKISSELRINIFESSFLDDFKKGNFPILTFALKNLKEILELNDCEEFILKNYFFQLDKKYNFKEIGFLFNLSGERIRQIKEKALSKITKFKKLKPFIKYSKYSEEIIQNSMICIPENIKSISIKKEIDKIGPVLSTIILGQVFDEHYWSFTSINKIKKPSFVYNLNKYNAHKEPKGAYLIKTKILSKIKAIKIFTTVLREICQRQNNEKLIPLTLFFKNDLHQEVLQLIEQLVKLEYGINLIEYNIIIPRNTNFKVFELVLEALEKIGRPAHISEIAELINSKHSEASPTESSIKASIGKQKDIFIYFGRSSTYGLKRWESQHKNIRGGTIRDIVEEFLNFNDEPCHLSAIADYVNKFRKTEGNHIITNLKMSANRFIFLEGSYIGLASKKYETSVGLWKKHEVQDVSIDQLFNSIFSK